MDQSGQSSKGLDLVFSFLDSSSVYLISSFTDKP